MFGDMKRHSFDLENSPLRHFHQTDVILVAWLPEHLIYGKPKILSVWRATALSLAEARDKHYHSPPHYLVFEPLDTSSRSRNLRQTNTNGYKFQGTQHQLAQAEEEVRHWGETGQLYSTAPDYQKRIRDLQARYPYRLDTNFAKIDRIQHEGLEKFKSAVLAMEIEGYSVMEWSKRHLVNDDQILDRLL